MVEGSKEVTPQKYSITVKLNAKLEAYGEYTVRADDFKELEDELEKVSTLFAKTVI